MAEKHPKSSHNPTAKSLERWENEGGAPKRPKRSVGIATGTEGKSAKNARPPKGQTKDRSISPKKAK